MLPEAPPLLHTHLSAHFPSDVSSTLSPYPLGVIRYLPSCPTEMERPRKHPFIFLLYRRLCVVFSIRCCVTPPPPSLPFSRSNIFSSWSGTEHIMDGSVKVIILLGWCPETISLHLRASVSLPILWIFYQLLNHGCTIGKVTCRARWYENLSAGISPVPTRAHR